MPNLGIVFFRSVMGRFAVRAKGRYTNLRLQLLLGGYDSKKGKYLIHEKGES